MLRLPPAHRLTIVVVLVSLLVRVVWVSLAHVTPISDFDDYDRRALTLLQGGELDAYRTPGYPGFLAAIYAAFGHSWLAAHLAQALLGALSSGLVVVLAARVVSARTAAIAGLLHAVWPTSVVYVAVLASENLATPLVLGLVLAVTTERKATASRLRLTAVAGLLFGLALLVRPALLFLGPAIGLLAVWEPAAARWRVMPGVAFVLATLVTVAPWQLHNHARGLGITTLSTTGGVNLWDGNNDHAVTGGYRGGVDAAEAAGFPTQEPERNNALQRAAITWITRHPGRYLTLSAIRARRMWGLSVDSWAAYHLWPSAEHDRVVRAAATASSDERAAAQTASQMLRRRSLVLTWFRVVFAPLMLVAVLACLRRRRAFAGILLPVASYATLVALTFFDPRFREATDPLLVIPLAALLSDLALGTAEMGWSRHRRVLLVVSVAAILAAVVAVVV